MSARIALVLLGLILASPLLAADRELQVALKDTEVAPHWIYDDLAKGIAQAKATNKPLMVVVRCVPCPPGKTLDAALMMPAPDLEQQEKNFVCVRIVHAKGLDLKLFQYDYDVSWVCMFLTPDLQVLGRYGTRAGGTRQTADTHISLPSFRKAMDRSLAIFKDYPANKSAIAAKTATTSDYRVPEEIPGLESRAATPTAPKMCIHCHMIKDNTLRNKWKEGRLTAADIWVYPLPESIGIKIDAADGLTVESIKAGSPAAGAGLAAGDELLSLGGQPLVSIADIQWVLHHTPAEAQLPITFTHNGQQVSKTINLSGDWKKGDITWRTSTWTLRQGVRFVPLTAAEKQKRGLAADSLAEQVGDMYGDGPAAFKKAGIQKNDVIIAVDGNSSAISESEFIANLRLKYGPKDTVKLTILRGTEKREIVSPMWYADPKP
jgi:serine protease Do